MVKRKEEIEKLRKASEMTDKGFAYICENIKPGMTEKEIAALPLGTFTQMIVDVFKKEEFSDFFQVVSGLLK